MMVDRWKVGRITLDVSIVVIPLFALLFDLRPSSLFYFLFNFGPIRNFSGNALFGRVTRFVNQCL